MSQSPAWGIEIDRIRALRHCSGDSEMIVSKEVRSMALERFRCEMGKLTPLGDEYWGLLVALERSKEVEVS